MSGNNHENKPVANDNEIPKIVLIEVLNKIVSAGLAGELESALVPGNHGWVKRVISSKSHPKEYTYPMIIQTAKGLLSQKEN